MSDNKSYVAKWLDPKEIVPPDERFIANIVTDSQFSYVTIGYIEGDYFYDLLSQETFYDVKRDEENQFEKIPVTNLKAWMLMPDAPKDI